MTNATETTPRKRAPLVLRFGHYYTPEVSASLSDAECRQWADHCLSTDAGDPCRAGCDWHGAVA